MSTPFKQRIDLINDGEPVNAGVTNRPISQLSERTISLLEKVDNGLFGSSQIAYAQAVESDSCVGTPVYLDNDGVWRKALFTYDTDDTFALAASSYVCGVISTKINSTLADITTAGLMYVTEAELTTVIDTGTVTTGQLYLSSSRAGGLSASIPRIGIPVAYCAGPDANLRYTFVINPQPRNVAEAHVHYKVPLAMIASNPTVTHPVAGWVATSTYASWFASRNITIPDGSTFYYLHAADPSLATIWPPTPLTSVELERNGIFMRCNDTGHSVVINEDGIWYSGSYSPITGASGSNVAAQSYDGAVDQIYVHYIRMVGRTGVVTSLTSADESTTITNHSGTLATTGALKIKATLATTTGEPVAGHEVIKTITGNVVHKGVVVEGVRVQPGSGLTLSGGTPVTEEPGDLITDYVGGRITIGREASAVLAEGHLDAIAFDGVRIADNNGYGVFGYTMPAGLTSSIKTCVRVPVKDISEDGASLTLEFLVLAKATGQLPTLGFTLYVLPQPVETCGHGSYTRQLPAAATTYPDLDLGSCEGDPYEITAGYYVKKTTQSITVYPGSILYFTITRDASDGYSGDLSILSLRYKIVLD